MAGTRIVWERSDSVMMIKLGIIMYYHNQSIKY
jgi:hypothetical protein